MQVRVGNRKIHLTRKECEEFIRMWLDYNERRGDWVYSGYPPYPLPKKIWRLRLGWSQYEDLYNDCIRMRAANLKYRRLATTKGDNVVTLYWEPSL